MKSKKNMAIISLVLSVLSLVPIIITPNSLNGTELFVVIGILLSIVGIILGFISVKDAKGLAITSIVIGILSCAVLCFSLIGFEAIKNATDCVDNGNGTSTCKYMGQEFEVPNYLLRDDQKQLIKE